MPQEPADKFYNVLEALMNFEFNQESYDNFVKLASSSLGKNWKDEIPKEVANYDEDTQDYALDKLTEVFNFEGATIAWNEANNILANPSKEKIKSLSSRIDDFRYWLDFYGQQGQELIKNIESLIAQGEQAPPPTPPQKNQQEENIEGHSKVSGSVGALSKVGFDAKKEKPKRQIQTTSAQNSHPAKINVYEHFPPPEQDFSHLEKGIDEEVLWYLNNYILLRDYYERTIARISGRCVKMGGLNLEDFPHFMYVVDLLDEICTTIDVIDNHPELDPLIDAKIKGGMKKYQKDKDFFKKELSENATPDMMEGYDLALAKQKLGKLADDDEVFKQEEDTGAGMGMNELLDKLSDDVDDSAFAGEEQQPKKKIKRKVKRKKVKRKIPKKANKAPPKKG